MPLDSQDTPKRVMLLVLSKNVPPMTTLGEHFLNAGPCELCSKYVNMILFVPYCVLQEKQLRELCAGYMVLKQTVQALLCSYLNCFGHSKGGRLTFS